MINVLFIVYHDLKVDERAQEELLCLKKLGNVTIVSYCNIYPDPEVTAFYNEGEKRDYRAFCKNAVLTMKRGGYDVVVLHDFYTAPLIPKVRRYLPESRIVYDSSELFYYKKFIKGKTFNAKMGVFLLLAEQLYLKKCDVVIAASIERAQIMQKRFKLKMLPLVFDNIHKINVDYDEDSCSGKYRDLFHEGRFTVFYAGGISDERMTYDIAESIGRLGDDYFLIVAGEATDSEKERFKRFLSDKSISNCVFIGFVSREDLKYLLLKSDVNISAFALDSVNNIYCASGKTYEGFFLGKPLLAGINPPLKKLCDDHHVGVSTDEFGAGCVQIRNHYQYYADNVIKYVESLDYDNRIDDLADQIRDRLVL